MAGSYTPYSDINRIWGLKNDYDNGNDEQKKKVQEEAKTYYNNLTSYGYGNYADTLKNSNAQQAGDFYRKVGKSGKTEFRPYVYNKMKQYGMSEADVDKIIKWDGDTGEILLGGKNIGKPTAVVDGSSYYDNSSTIDKAIDDYVKNNSISKSADTLYAENNEKISNLMFEDYETGQKDHDWLKDKIDANAFEGEEADAIRASYGVKGTDAYNNALAESAGSNSGNIDSFGQAQANRWAAYYNSLADQAILQNKQNNVAMAQTAIDNYADNNNMRFQNMRYQNQAIFDDRETKLDNELARESEKATLYGYDPNTVNAEYGDVNSYNPNVDYQAKLDEISKKLREPGLTETERLGLTQQYNSYAQQRNNKIDSNPDLYGDLVHTALIPIQTAEERLLEHERDENKKNNTVERARVKGEITGYAPVEIDGRYYDAYGNMLSPEEYEEQKKRADLWGIDYKQPTLERHGLDSANELAHTEIASKERMNQYSADSDYAGTVYKADSDLAGTMYKADSDYAGTVYKADKSFDETKYKTDNKTTSGSSSGSSSKGSKPVSDSEVKKWVKFFNDGRVEEFGEEYVPFKETAPGQYTLINPSRDSDHIIYRVMKSDLTAEQKEYLLVDKFGISLDSIYNVTKDNHYK